MTADDRWMIWSNRRAAWWKGSLHDYTLDWDEAGVFTRTEAEHAIRGSVTGPDGVPTSVIVRAPDGRVPWPRTQQIVQAARVLAESAQGWIWGDHGDWPALVKLMATVHGLPFPATPLPQCPDCGHADYHCPRDGCLTWKPNAASVLKPAGLRCRCRARNDLNKP